MRDEPMTVAEWEAYGEEIAYENHIAEEAERRYYRDRSLDLFFEWCDTQLDSIIRRDPSEAYEAFHERRLAVGLTEEQEKAERVRYTERKANREYQATLALPF